MLVYTMSHGELWTTVFCSYCSRDMGRYSTDEVAAMLRDPQGAICFDCEGGNVDEIHPVFKLEDGPHALVIGDEVFRVDTIGQFLSLGPGLPYTRKSWQWLDQVRFFSWGGNTLSSTSKRSADA